MRKGQKHSLSAKLQMSKVRKGRPSSFKGKHQPDEAKRKLREIHKGKHYSPNTEFKRGIKKPETAGANNPMWKGGITTENQRIRYSIDYRLWREAVFARDNFTCQKTGLKSEDLRAHHIQNFAQFPELRFAIDNGITLSEKAHKEFHKTYGQMNNTKQQIEAYLTA